MPADERLGEPDVLDELGHRGRAGRQALDDPQPVDVGEGLVEEAELAQLVGLVDDRRDGRADPGGRGTQGRLPGGRRARRLNGDLYKSQLMLRPTSSRVNPVRSTTCRPSPTARYTPPVSRGASLVLLGVLGAGVFLAGLELMITAVALPSIVVDLARRAGSPSSGWTQLRRASWIVNGYLLVYVATMPLAGRLADLWGARRLFLGALAIFTLGSFLAGAAQTLDELIAARLVQAVGGGILVPVGDGRRRRTCSSGHDRPRALGVIGALTFLGMAAGPFVGAAILRAVHAESALAAAGISVGAAGRPALTPAWRWVFYLNVPIGIVALALAWAASSGWETPRRAGPDRPARRGRVHGRPRSPA